MVSGEWFFQYTTLYNSTYNTYNTTYFIMIELRLIIRLIQDQKFWRLFSCIKFTECALFTNMKHNHLPFVNINF